MLILDIPAIEAFDENTNEFISISPTSLHMEHSLVSVSKWEEKWHKPFLSPLKEHEKTDEEMMDYIRCMTITKNVDENLFKYMPPEYLMKINEYIQDRRTATWFNKQETTNKNREITTSELIYYWMIKLNIPVEFQKWHLNRLMTLIEIFSIKDAPPKKVSKSELARQRSALNAARLAKYHTKG